MINDREIESEAVVSARLRKNRGRKPWKDGKPVILSYVSSLDSISLSWKGASITTEYKINRDGILLDTVTDLTYTDSGLEPDQSYLYEIIATYRNIYFSPGVTVTARTVVLPIPQWLEPIITTTSITLSWQSLGDAFIYVLFKDGIEVTRMSDLVYTFTGLISSSEYSFEIRSIQSCNCTIGQSQGNVVSLTTLVAPPPSILYAKPVSYDKVLIFWPQVEGAKSYTINRNGETLIEVFSSPFTDEGLDEDSIFSYTIQANGNNASSSPSIMVPCRTNSKTMVLDLSDKPDGFILGTNPLYGGDTRSELGFYWFGNGNRWQIEDITTSPFLGFQKIHETFPGLVKTLYHFHGSTVVHYMYALNGARFNLKSIVVQPGKHQMGCRIGGWADGIEKYVSNRKESALFTPFRRILNWNNLQYLKLQRISTFGSITLVDGTTSDAGWPIAYFDISIEWI
jgi:hypothetical protein